MSVTAPLRRIVRDFVDENGLERDELECIVPPLGTTGVATSATKRRCYRCGIEGASPSRPGTGGPGNG